METEFTSWGVYTKVSNHALTCLRWLVHFRLGWSAVSEGFRPKLDKKKHPRYWQSWLPIMASTVKNAIDRLRIGACHRCMKGARLSHKSPCTRLSEINIILKLYSPHYPVNITFSRRGRSAKSYFSSVVYHILARYSILFGVHVRKLY